RAAPGAAARRAGRGALGTELDGAARGAVPAEDYRGAAGRPLGGGRELRQDTRPGVGTGGAAGLAGLRAAAGHGPAGATHAAAGVDEGGAVERQPGAAQRAPVHTAVALAVGAAAARAASP